MRSTSRLHPVASIARSLLGAISGRSDEIVRDGRRLDPEVQAMLKLSDRVSPLDNRDVESAGRHGSGGDPRAARTEERALLGA